MLPRKFRLSDPKNFKVVFRYGSRVKSKYFLVRVLLPRLERNVFQKVLMELHAAENENKSSSVSSISNIIRRVIGKAGMGQLVKSPKMAVITSSKSIKLAVKRNRSKRRVREILRNNVDLFFPGARILVTVLFDISNVEWDGLKKDLIVAIKKAELIALRNMEGKIAKRSDEKKIKEGIRNGKG